mmetsp:Transcript_11757/g.26620  ORF Transcript_11757/g.26620 Transcript_11757/m.26620 type:complete len:232 (+) Transcript_11757:472-1167(+)
MMTLTSKYNMYRDPCLASLASPLLLKPPVLGMCRTTPWSTTASPAAQVPTKRRRRSQSTVLGTRRVGPSGAVTSARFSCTLKRCQSIPLQCSLSKVKRAKRQFRGQLLGYLNLPSGALSVKLVLHLEHTKHISYTNGAMLEQRTTLPRSATNLPIDSERRLSMGTSSSGASISTSMRQAARTPGTGLAAARPVESRAGVGAGHAKAAMCSPAETSAMNTSGLSASRRAKFC